MALLGNRYIDLSQSCIEELTLSSTSKGNQKKYYNHDTHEYIKLPFNYRNRVWRDYLVEHLAWRLSTMMNLGGVVVLKQDVARVGEAEYCCVSEDFCYGKDCEWVSFRRIMGYNDISRKYGYAKRMFDDILKIYSDECGINAENYLIAMIVMDYLLLNEDRHFNNFGVLRFEDGHYEMPPLFDFGLGLFEHDTKYKGLDLYQAIDLAECKPFSKDQHLAIKMLLNTGHAGAIRSMVNGVRVPNRRLFPNNLGFEYFKYALDSLSKELEELDV